ncbi:hypothetical protein [[Micrococcus luteus] ATCC 49442]|uniref:hypothetical protein n=1 Tax=[Micrococcus luteus] ATCC 49442 TaxID=2698727 RepID=UPI0013D901E0|nr:hypothetical protein [[Micrococcus luteus] ATCC 49442]
MSSTRKTTTNNSGTATYVYASDAPPAWLVSAIPGADKAKAAWDAENAKGRELSREFRESGKALVALRNSRPLASELELAERAHADKEHAVKAQAHRALVALQKFDTLAYSGLGTPEAFRAMAAEHALAKHAEAVEAWATLKTAITERDQARNAAGAPGHDWRASAPAHYSSLQSVATVVDSVLDGFDLRALKLTIDGEL